MTIDMKRKTECNLNQLPLEIMNMILDLTDLNDLLQFSKTCKRYYIYITNHYQTFWKKSYLKRWNCLEFCPNCVSTKCNCSDLKSNWKLQFFKRLEYENSLNDGSYNRFIIYENYFLYKKTTDSVITCNGSVLSVSEIDSNRSITMHDNISCVALAYPELIAISINGKGIRLYDYKTLSERTSLNVISVSQILLNSTKLICIDSKTMIKTWNISNYGSKSKFHALFWNYHYEIQGIQFYKDLIVSFDHFQCNFWDWNTKTCIKIINCQIYKAVIHHDIIGLFSTGLIQIYRSSNGISKLQDIKVSYIFQKDDKYVINSENIVIKGRLQDYLINHKTIQLQLSS